MDNCALCKYQFKSYHDMYVHLKWKHNLKSKEYYDKYIKQSEEGICLNCGLKTKFFDLRHGYRIYCSSSCVSKSYLEKQKMKETLIKHFGVDNPSKSSEIQERKIKTFQKRFGCDHPLKNEVVKQKIKDTCLKKYGYPCSLQSPVVKEKVIRSIMNHFLCEYPLQSNIVKQKMIRTCIEKYGYRWPTLVPKIREQIKNTLFENYGVIKLSKSKKIVELQKKGCLNKYGVTTYSQTPQGRRNLREWNINRVEQQKLNGDPLIPCIGKDARICLDILEKLTKYKIVREVRVCGYFLDGYISEINLAIEFQEKHHLYKKQKEHDERKEIDIIDELDCNYLVIWESEWIDNQNQILNQFREITK